VCVYKTVTKSNGVSIVTPHIPHHYCLWSTVAVCPNIQITHIHTCWWRGVKRQMVDERCANTVLSLVWWWKWVKKTNIQNDSLRAGQTELWAIITCRCSWTWRPNKNNSPSISITCSQQVTRQFRNKAKMFF